MTDISDETLLAWADRVTVASTWTSGLRARDLRELAVEILGSSPASAPVGSPASTLELDDVKATNEGAAASQEEAEAPVSDEAKEAEGDPAAEAPSAPAEDVAYDDLSDRSES